MPNSFALWDGTYEPVGIVPNILSDDGSQIPVAITRQTLKQLLFNALYDLRALIYERCVELNE